MEFLEDSIYEVDDKVHFSVTTRILEFSNKSIHYTGSEADTKYLEQDGELGIFSLKVFPNGFSEETKGSVCVIFDSLSKPLTFVGQCIISVKDVSDNQRFSETFVIFDYKEDRQNRCIQYISREKLLNDPDEYLRNDTLTFLIDAYITVYIMTGKPVFYANFKYSREDGHPIELYLDSTLGKHLAKESSFFRGISMIEESTKTIPIDEPEFWHHIEHIFIGTDCLRFKSVKDIFDLYILADKYDIPTVTEVCTWYLKFGLLNNTVDKYLEIADGYENEYLKELLLDLIGEVKNVDFQNKVLSSAVRMKQPICQCTWCYTKRSHEIVKKPSFFIPPRDETFDFYQ